MDYGSTKDILEGARKHHLIFSFAKRLVLTHLFCFFLGLVWMQDLILAFSPISQLLQASNLVRFHLACCVTYLFLDP